MAGPDCKDVRRYYPNGEQCDNGCTYCADIPEVHFSYVDKTRNVCRIKKKSKCSQIQAV